ncbi:MAG: hypothetical protein ACLQVY_12125 [Limisphaerales bacterium]
MIWVVAARRIYDPAGVAAVIDVEVEGLEGALTRTADLLAQGDLPIFEAGFEANGLDFETIQFAVPLWPELSYEQFEGVKDGTTAMEAFREAIRPDLGQERKRLIENRLFAYCSLDTYAQGRLWFFFSGRRWPKGAVSKPNNSWWSSKSLRWKPR